MGTAGLPPSFKELNVICFRCPPFEADTGFVAYFADGLINGCPRYAVVIFKRPIS